MAKFKIPQCPVCGGKSFEDFLSCTDFLVSQEEYIIKKCSGCGLKITFDVDDEETIGKYYSSEEYIPHSGKSSGLVTMLYHQVRSYMLHRKRSIIGKVTGKKTGNILDVGTGTGFFLNEMQSHGWKVYGTEKSDRARNFARSEFNIGIKETEDLFKYKDKQFDVITLWHALEHIHLLNKNMEVFGRLLKNDGNLIIAVPNNNSFDAGHYGKFWAAWDVPRHIWHFNPEQMKLLGEKYGFKLKNIHTMPFDSFYVSILSKKNKKSVFPFLPGILYGKISWLISLFNKTKCSSLIYIFEKKP